MGNKSVSDFVASTMDAVLKSEQHQSLFGLRKVASFGQVCEVCNTDDCASAGCSGVSEDEGAETLDSDELSDKEVETFVRKHRAQVKKYLEDEGEDEDYVSDGVSAELGSSAFDVAIDSLLTASAALDKVGFEKGSSFSLKLASIVVEAKKKEKAKAKAKKDSKTSKDSKSSKDSKKTSKDGKSSKDSKISKDSGKSSKDSKTSKDIFKKSSINSIIKKSQNDPNPTYTWIQQGLIGNIQELIDVSNYISGNHAGLSPALKNDELNKMLNEVKSSSLTEDRMNILSDRLSNQRKNILAILQ